MVGCSGFAERHCQHKVVLRGGAEPHSALLRSLYLENNIRKALPYSCVSHSTMWEASHDCKDMAGCYFGRVVVRSSDTASCAWALLFRMVLCVRFFRCVWMCSDGWSSAKSFRGKRDTVRRFPSFLLSFLPSLLSFLILIYLGLRQWEAFAFFSSPPRLS